MLVTHSEFVIEGAGYQSVSQNLATEITPPKGFQFAFKEFDMFPRAQTIGEGDEFTREKGSTRLQFVPFHTIGLRSYATEEEVMDTPLDTQRLELNAIGASISLERDLFWMDSLYNATSGSNLTTFNNSVTLNPATSSNPDIGVVDVGVLLAVITYMKSPFNLTSTKIDLANTFAEVEGLQRLGKFRPTDVVVSGATMHRILSTVELQSQNFWKNSQILDTGELRVPLLGVSFWVANVGYFADDGRTWIDSDDVYVIDRNMGGGGTIGVRQPLTLRNWETPQFRTMDFHVYTRLGFAVQNRRAIMRIESPGSGS